MGNFRRNIIGYFLLFIFINSYGQIRIYNKLNKIQLQTINNKDFKITRFDKKLLGFVFLSPDCPLSQNYTLVLKKLIEKYSADMDIIGIFSGTGYQMEDYKKFGTKYNINFTLVADRSNGYAKTFSATTTPEVFLVDRQKNILYSGAIDNWAVSLGRQMKKPTMNYLEDAIKEYLNNAPIVIKKTKPIGCLISINSN